MDAVQMPPGTTECNHSYYTGNPFSAPHSAQQLQNGTLATPVQPPASMQEVNGAASSSFVCNQLTSHCGSLPVMAQVVSCRSLKRSRSSHSLSSYNTAAFHLPRLSRLSYQSLSHSWMLLCRQTHLVTSFRMWPRRRLINRTRFRVTWQCRRLPTVPISHPWMLPRRRPHPVPCLSMSPRRWVLDQLPRFLLI